jgi:hypothetical protein
MPKESEYEWAGGHPAGEIDLSTLTDYVGAEAQEARTEYLYTVGCCGGLTSSHCWETIPGHWTLCQILPHES